MKNKRINMYVAAVIVAFVFLLAGCGRGAKMESSPFLDSLTASLEDISNDPNSTTHDYSLTIKESAGKLVDVDFVDLQLLMSMNGMTHDMVKKMQRSGLGEYQAELEWPMSGNWREIITLSKDGHKRKISLQI